MDPRGSAPSNAEVTVACGSTIGGAQGMRLGSNYSQAVFFKGRCLLLQTSDTTWTDGDYANIKAYVNTRYGLAL
jgi:hypothetical protein